MNREDARSRVNAALDRMAVQRSDIQQKFAAAQMQQCQSSHDEGRQMGGLLHVMPEVQA